MNLTDIDLSKATPIGFDDIREGDTVVRRHLNVVSIIEVKQRPDRASVLGPGGGFLFDTNDAPSEWFLLSRPSPPVAPGTTGSATVCNVEGMRVMRARVRDTWGWVTTGGLFHADDDIEDFTPDRLITPEVDAAVERLRSTRVGHEQDAVLNLLAAFRARDV